jgi:hypothetical protein
MSSPTRPAQKFPADLRSLAYSLTYRSPDEH